MGRAAALRSRQKDTPVISVTKKRKIVAFNGGNFQEERYPKRSRFIAIPYQAPESALKISHCVKTSQEISKIPIRLNKRPSPKTLTAKKAKPQPATVKRGKVAAAAARKKRNPRQAKINSPTKAASDSALAKIRTPSVKKKNPEKKNLQIKLKKVKKQEVVKKEVGAENNKADAKSQKPVKSKRKSRKGALEPKPHVTHYDEDPTFMSKLPVPSVSSLADSRLLIRAVLLDDNRLLDSLLNSNKGFCSRSVPRNHNDPSNAFTYALQRENIHAIVKLLEDKNLDKMAPFPAITLERDSTGHGSRLMFGHALSQVTVGRGGKEGNGAFLKDQGVYNTRIIDTFFSDNITTVLTAGLSFETIKMFPKISGNDYLMSSFYDRVVLAIRSGHHELAGKIIAEANLRGGFGFNALHEQVLLKNGEPLPPFKPVSAVKKSTGNSRVTPLHCAAINPNPVYLTALLNTHPEGNVLDSDNWTLLHYAAVCKSPKPLQYLLSHTGIPSVSINKEGNTPLHLACQHGRLENVLLILKHELTVTEEEMEDEGSNEEDMEQENNSNIKANKNRSLTSTSLVIVNKKGFTVLQTAAKFGQALIMAALLDVPGIDVNKATSATHEKMSPLILASVFGHLNAVKFLCENKEKYNVKLEQPDRRGRTALAHAVINGHAHIVSFLLRFGLNHLAVDTSGNTLLHYAAAYGWYFNCKLLIEAGCPVNCSNLWKLTPIAAAFMKGHNGIVQLFLEHPDVDINSPVNYQTGKSLLLVMCSSNSSQELVNRIRTLVDENGADCKLSDYNKNNALHILVLTEASEKDKRRYSSTPYDSSPEQKYLVEIAKFLLSQGCDLVAINEQHESPVSLAVKLGCFVFICRLLENSKLLLNSSVDEEGNTLLHSLVKNATNPGAETFYRRVSNNTENIQVLRQMAAIKNKQGRTPLLELIASVKRNSGKEKREIKRVSDLLSFIVHDLQSDVNAISEDDSRNSVLHFASDAESGDEYLKVLLRAKPNLETLNACSNTPLVTGILAGKVNAIKLLLDAGANVNVEVQRPGGSSWPVILEVADKGIGDSFSLLTLLVKKGAEVSKLDSGGNSALHLVCKKPALPGCAEAVQELVRKGCSADRANKKGRTPLHLCVNSRGGGTDVTYEVEDALIEASPKSLSIWDIRGRVPLHYAFVKIGNFQDKSFIDPIELVALLVKAMKDGDAVEELEFADAFQATPMHYAAARGATISATLLVGDSTRVLDLPDKDGNTPFGLAVLNGHQACALFFQQRKANFTVLINKIREEVKEIKEVGWIWTKILRELEEKKKEQARVNIVSLLEQVVSQEWQGILYLLIEALRQSGNGVGAAVQAAIKTGRLKLAHKILLRVKSAVELEVDKKDGTVIHTLAKYCGEGTEGQIGILTMILDKGVDVFVKDEFQSTAIIYAARARNVALCRELAEQMQQRRSGSLSEIIGRDLFGRNHLAAIFELSFSKSPSDELKNWVKNIVRAGDWNIRSNFPLEMSDFPAARYVGLTELAVQACAEHNCFTPLIASVIYGNYSAVKWLLNHQTCPADANFPDSRGRTALMHAVRMNDIKMVKLLLNPKNYTPEDDNVPWQETNFSTHSKKIDFLARDKDGQTLFHHLITPSNLPFYYTNSHVILNLIAKVSSASKGAVASDKTLLPKAITLNRDHILQSIQKLTGTSPAKSSIIYSEFPTISETAHSPPTNVKEDALAMVKKLASSRAVNNESALPSPDDLIGDEAKHFAVVVTDGKVYDCVMTKVDLSYGMYGLYNFYKMQLLQQPKGKGLIILFTRWGRVGDNGQYQKTPFASLEEGIKEFQKIFRSKSGNVWENSEMFNPIPGKYRLVDKGMRRVLPPHVPVDFTGLEQITRETESQMPEHTFELIQNLSLVHKTQGRLRDIMNCSGQMVDLPFGFVTPEAFERGEEILKKIGALLVEKRKMDKNFENTRKEDEQKLMESLTEASEEFYSVIPVYGFSTERIQPILNEEAVRDKEDMIHKILHLQYASQLIFASHFNGKNQNPMDYIYSCLKTKIQILKHKDFETQMILQYIHNTGSEEYSSKPVVLNIYRVEREGEAATMRESGIENRWLLWHGTRAVNLLSILANGLQVAPLGAELNGSLFGKGIYFADMFAKSNHYTETKGRRFLLLCEVALGNVYPINTQDMNEKMAKLPNGFQSLKTADSRYEPDPGATIYWQNRAVPLGERTVQILKKDHYHALDYNEYVVFDTKQVNIKYLVEFGDQERNRRNSNSGSDNSDSDNE